VISVVKDIYVQKSNLTKEISISAIRSIFRFKFNNIEIGDTMTLGWDEKDAIKLKHKAIALEERKHLNQQDSKM